MSAGKSVRITGRKAAKTDLMENLSTVTSIFSIKINLTGNLDTNSNPKNSDHQTTRNRAALKAARFLVVGDLLKTLFP